MKMKKNLYMYIFLGSALACLSAKTADSSVDVPSAHDLQRKLHHAHHEKLCVIQDVDTKDHFGKIMECHEKIRAIETHGAVASNSLDPHECTTSKCQIMRLIHQISFNVQALMKLMKPKDVARIKQINEQIHKLKILLRQYGIDDKTFEKHPVSIYL